jgi:short-subunit dehydrogenase
MNRGIRRELAFLAGLASAGCWMMRRKGLAKVLAASAAALHFCPSVTYSFRNRSVVITGSSRGLGLALAEQFLREGARVALIARNSEELDRAQALLLERVSGQIFTLSCDVTQPTEIKRAFELIEGVFGRIDILVNNAGAIVIGPLEAMEREDFDAMLDLQVHAILETTHAVLPIFRQFGGGRIANICSIGGKIGVPHMSTYCAAKFALAGLSSVMASELAAENIAITTVFPGMMRVGSTVQAVIKGDHEKEYAWFALGNAVPGLSVSAAHAAREILKGIRAGDAQVTFPGPRGFFRRGNRRSGIPARRARTGWRARAGIRSSVRRSSRRRTRTTSSKRSARISIWVFESDRFSSVGRRRKSSARHGRGAAGEPAGSEGTLRHGKPGGALAAGCAAPRADSSESGISARL